MKGLRLRQAQRCLRRSLTRPGGASVKKYLAAIEDKVRRKDCEALVKLMSKVTKEPPAMWGSSIVGFGSYHYKYASGREGDMCVTGFSSSKREISVYLVASGADQDKLLKKLGKHKMGKACLYFKRLADLDTKILEALVFESVAETRCRHTVAGAA